MELYQYPEKKQVKYFNIEAVQIPIVYNKYGGMTRMDLCMCLRRTHRELRERRIYASVRCLRSPMKRYSRLLFA